MFYSLNGKRDCLILAVESFRNMSSRPNAQVRHFIFIFKPENSFILIEIMKTVVSES